MQQGYGACPIRGIPAMTAASNTYLTIESMNALIDRIENAPIQICGITRPHAFHPDSKDGSWQMCAMCLNIFQIPAGFEAKFERA